MSIEVRGVSKTFGSFAALKDVNLKVETGELIALLGPSGSGKTTLLRIIAGLEFPTQGSILFGDEDIVGRDARSRQVGFVFQHYALFRHMTVFENIAFGLRVPAPRDPSAQSRHQGPGHGAAETRPTGRAGGPLSLSAFGRATAAGRPGPRPGR